MMCGQDRGERWRKVDESVGEGGLCERNKKEKVSFPRRVSFWFGVDWDGIRKGEGGHRVNYLLGIVVRDHCRGDGELEARVGPVEVNKGREHRRGGN